MNKGSVGVLGDDYPDCLHLEDPDQTEVDEVTLIPTIKFPQGPRENPPTLGNFFN